MTHTKGEWKVKERTGPFAVDILANNKRVCEVKSFGVGFNDPIEEEADANAKLIAAAPELLKALVDANNELKNMHNYVSKVRNQILDNDIDCVSHIGIDEIDDIMLIGLKSEQAIKKAS